MKHNTIEVKLNSYGTLEVVTAPVKLYKDSYNVVKLRVNAPMVAESMLKVYLGDEDEAGEKVWTSNAYSWQIKETVVINGVPYNVYEEYLPQEFCSESGDIRITFAQVVGKDGVNQILTSGSLNLYVSGDGFNFNGVEIAESDKLAIKINEVLTYYKDYDLKIRSQAEFEAFCDSLINETCSASSVLFVGDGGNLTFTRQIDKALILPKTLKRIDGINNAKIYLIRSYAGTVTHEMLRYSDYKTISPEEYSMNNLSFVFEVQPSGGITGLVGFNNIYNCNFTIIGGKNIDMELIETGILVECKDIINCNITGEETMQSYVLCKNIVNCEGTFFYKCDNIINSKATMFGSCKYLTNCTAESNVSYNTDFSGCDYLTNCSSLSNGLYSFFSCNYITNCVGVKQFKTCTNIFATQEDIEGAKAYVDDKVGNLMVALQDINSGEGV